MKFLLIVMPAILDAGCRMSLKILEVGQPKIILS